MKFENKVVVVTGASSGIGAATAVEFAKFGAKLALSGRNLDNLGKTATRCQQHGGKIEDIFIVTGDLTKTEDCLNLVDMVLDKFGRIDVLVNNAGFSAHEPVMDSTLEDLDSMLNIHLRAVFSITQRALPSIIENKGAIVNVSSVASTLVRPGSLPYTVAKAAQDQYTRVIALEVADKGVRVNAVNPGVVLTNILGDLDSKDPTGRTVKENMSAAAEFLHPNNRAGTPEDVARAIVFLASPDNYMITGVTLPIEGGFILDGCSKKKIEDLSAITALLSKQASQ